MLHQRLPWYIGGPVLGLCVVAIRLLLNGRLGLLGSFRRSSSVSAAGASPSTGAVLIGLVAGSVLFAILYGGPSFEGYGWLTATFKGDAAILIAPILVVAGVLIGFGAKAAGGCTSGNGLSGNAMASPASITATATFFGTAIVVSFVIKAVI